jgi:hypothetical protein
MSTLTLLSRQRVWLADLVQAFNWDSEQIFKDMIASRGRPTRPESLTVRLQLYRQHYAAVFKEALTLQSSDARRAQRSFAEALLDTSRAFNEAIEEVTVALSEAERLSRQTVESFGYAAQDMGLLFGEYAKMSNPLIDIPAARTATIEGFNTRVIVDLPQRFIQEAIERGIDLNRELNDVFGRARYALRKYRERAQTAMPWLLTHALPLDILIANPTQDRSVVSGRYLHGHIQLFLLGDLSTDPATFIETLAHEMGHHIWRSRLSAATRSVWAASRGLLTNLDLQTILERWQRAAARDPEASTLIGFVEVLDASDDPRDHDLAVQIENLVRKQRDAGGPHPLPNHVTLALAMAMGAESVEVVGRPITVYAETNAEEAFCEAFGLLMAYGPRRVPPDVALVMERVLPEFKFRQVRPLRGV